MSDLNLPAQKSAYFVRKTAAAAPSSDNAQTNTTSPPGTSTAAQKNASVLNIPGTKTSLQNSQLLTPIGIPSIDSFIGGGLPVGGVCVIGQDVNNYYANVITRCFVAEGVSHKHGLFLADLIDGEERYLQRIPSASKTDEPDLNSATAANKDDQLRIAWRYGQQPTTATDSASSVRSLQPNYFVMNKLMTKEEVYAGSSGGVATFSLGDCEPDDVSKSSKNVNMLYCQLAKKITEYIDSLNLNITKTKQYTNVLRIVIDSIGGLVWNDKCTVDDEYAAALCRFLIYMRNLLRHSLAVCVITVPNELVSNADLYAKVTHLTDYSFVIDDSVPTASRLTNTQYEGLFRLVKLPALNSLVPCFVPETLDLAFHMKRRRLVVEQLHLPPDLGEDDNTQKGRTGGSSVTMSCSSGGSSSSGNSKLDF